MARWSGQRRFELRTKARRDERGQWGQTSRCRAGVLAGWSSADRETAKGTESHGSGRSRDGDRLSGRVMKHCLWAPETFGARRPKRSPQEQTLRTHHGFGACPPSKPFAAFSSFRGSRSCQHPPCPHTPPDTPEARPRPPPMSFRSFACGFSAAPKRHRSVTERCRPAQGDGLALDRSVEAALRFRDCLDRVSPDLRVGR